MICRRCGADIPPGLVACRNCGAAADEMPEIKKVSVIPAILAVLVVGVVTVLVLALSGLDFTPFGKQVGDLADEYVSIMFGGDRADLIDLSHKKAAEHRLKESGMTEYEYRKTLSEESETLRDSYDQLYGADWTMHYTVQDQRNVLAQESERIRQEYEELYGLPVDAVKCVDMEVTIAGSRGETTFVCSVVMVKVYMCWYLA